MNNEREIREAICAAEYALDRLNEARNCLKSASNWGWLDIFGGGFISTMMKQSKMSRAQREVAEAQQAIRSFARELRDVDALVHLDLRIDDFLGFADYFFDNAFADWMVQQRIREAQRQVDEAIHRVTFLRGELRRLMI